MKIGEIQNCMLFSGVDRNLLQSLVEKGQIFETAYAKSSSVHNQGESCSALDVVISGSLVAYSLSQNGSETVMFEFSAGSLIGANLLFGDSNVYPLNIYSLTACRLLQVTKPAVTALLENHEFMMRYIHSLSQNSQGMNRKIAIFTQKSLRENILDYLAVQSIQQKSSAIMLPVTKKHLADYFGVQRPSLFRELKKLSEEGLITVRNREITVCSLQDTNGRLIKIQTGGDAVK